MSERIQSNKEQVIAALLKAEQIMLTPGLNPEQIQRLIAYIDSFNNKSASNAIRHVAGERHNPNHMK
jgi:hypothetical protein